MTAKLTYRTIIAAFLLGLYAFIATPVQVWHQHKYATNTSESDARESKDFVKSDSTTIDENCQICSHHYSVYANETHAVIAIPSIEYDVIQSYYLHSFPGEPYFHSTGRGPPTV